MTPEPLPPKSLLWAVIVRSGLTVSAWARDVAMREPRTVRRWLAGDSPIPRVVQDKLKELLP